MHKLPGGSTAPITKLKSLVQRDDAAFKEILSWQKEVVTNSVIRSRISFRFGIKLKGDTQVSDFMGWLHNLVLERCDLYRMASDDIRLIVAGRAKRARYVLGGKFSQRNAVPASRFIKEALTKGLKDRLNP